MDHCPRFDATAAAVLQPSSSSSSNSKYRSNTKVDGKDDYQDSQSNRIEGWTPVVSGTPFGKFNGQLVARRRSKLMVGTPGAKQRILVDHEAEAQRLAQSNLLKVGLPLSRMGKVQLWTADPYRRDDEFRG